MSVRDHHKGLRKPRRKLPDYVRKAGPHQPARNERRQARSDAIRRAIEESIV